MSLRTKSAALSFAVVAMCSAHAQIEPTADGEVALPVTPPDVFQAVLQVHFKLVALRHVIGKPPVEDEASFVVLAAAPRHGFYHAQELFRKAHQLAEEVAEDRQLPLDEIDADWRRGAPRPAPQDREVVPADVLQVVNDTRDRIEAALFLLNVNVTLRDPPERDASKQTADILVEIMKINRQLNRMMDRALRMRDVYAQVLKAINYAGDLGAGYPPLQATQESQQPLNAYQRLIVCLHLVRQVGERLGVRTLDWQDSGELAGEDLVPADVYDLATTVLSELAYLAEHVDADRTVLPRGEYRRPRDISPVHVFQLVGALETQLRILAAQAISGGAGGAEDAGIAGDDRETGANQHDAADGGANGMTPGVVTVR